MHVFLTLISGAWDRDGKGESIWDNFCHERPEKIETNNIDDHACNTYEKYEEDVQLLKELGVTFYRFSISWPRLLPKGTLEEVNQKGFEYYNKLINALVQAGIKPVVTLFHWDMPQVLHEKGGWLSDEVRKSFEDYARLCFTHFGDRVKIWGTFNEPWVFIKFGYAEGFFAPGHEDAPGTEPYLIGHHVLKTHAAVYHIYDKEFRHLQDGKIAIMLSSDFYEPKDKSNNDDVEAAKRCLEFDLGWFAHPVFKGDYPEIMKKKIAEKSKAQGLASSRLPEFTEDEKKFILGTSDFFSLNHYTSRYVTSKEKPIHPPKAENDADTEEHVDEKWEHTDVPWAYTVPWGLRKQLEGITKEYGNPPIYIFENGYGSSDPTTDDTLRVNYLKHYINETLKAIRNGSDVRAYTVWSFLDVKEWVFGYHFRYGLYHVDFTDPNRKRTPKESARFYAKIIKDNGFMKN